MIPGAIDDAACDEQLGQLDALSWSPEQFKRSNRIGEDGIRELRIAAAVRAVSSRRQLFEVVVDLWHDHLCTSVDKGAVNLFLTFDDRNAYRPHALGRFSDLLTAVSLSGSMLHYLDTVSSAAPEVNENHGRELLELHTVGVEGGYSEADVLGAARVLSGWGLDDALEVRFDPTRHDSGPASVLGWSTPGRSGADAAGDAPAMLQHLARHPATAQRVAARLVQRFVSDLPPADLVASAADVYLSSDTDIAATLRHILFSQWFRGGGLTTVRRPFDLVGAVLRATNAALDLRAGAGLLGGDAPDVVESVMWTMDQLGQPLFRATDPSGWPVAGRPWLSADALHHRWSLAGDVGHQRLDGICWDEELMVDPSARTVGGVVDQLVARLYGHAASAPTRAGAIAVAGDGAAEDAPFDGDRLHVTVTYLLAAPEMQIR